MTDKQPEALRLADKVMMACSLYHACLENPERHMSTLMGAAAELRRLHEINAELVYLLNRYVSETPVGHQPHMIVDLVIDAIAKATGENND